MKRKYYLTSSLILLLLINLSQAQNIDPVVQEGRQWATRILCSVNPVEYNPVHTETYRMEGDTVIDQLTYKKIYCYKTPDLSDRQLFRYACRQDNQKVFIYFYYTQNEALFFDFSLDNCDVFEEKSRSYKVFSVHDTLLNDGVTRKCIHLKDITRDDNIKIWVEGLGSLEKGIYWEPFDIVGCTGTLLCCHQNGVQIYRNPDYNNCFVDKVTNEQSEPNPAAFWRLSPQPATESVQAVCEAVETGWYSGSWRLVDAGGKALRHGTFSDGRFDVSLRAIPAGLYFIEITANGTTCRLKCVKR